MEIKMRKSKFVSGDKWDGPVWLKWFQTINLNLTCIALGLIVSLIGPTLIDLSEIFKTSIQKAAHLGTVADFGSIVGPFLADFLFRRFNAQTVCIVSGFLIGVANILIPLGNLEIAYVLGFVSGLFLAIIEVGAFVWLVGLWRGNRPILQLYSLMFGIGAMTSPLIAKPFLSPESQLMANATANRDHAASNGNAQVIVPFAIIGSFAAFVAASMTASYWVDPRDVRPEPDEEAKDFNLRDWILTFLVSLFHLLVVFCETSFNRFVVIYAMEMYGVAKGNAALLVSLFWTGFTVVRIIIIPLTIKVKSVYIVVFGQFLFTTACLCMYIFSHSDDLLSLKTFMVGFGLGPLYGGSLTWLTEQITLRHAYLSLIMVLTCGGSMIAVPIVGPYIEDEPIFLTRTLAFTSISMLFVVLAMLIAARVLPERKREKSVAKWANSSVSGVDNPSIQVVDETVNQKK